MRHHHARLTGDGSINAGGALGWGGQPEVIPAPVVNGGRAQPARRTWLGLRPRRAGLASPLARRSAGEVSLPCLPPPSPHLLRVLEGAVIDFPVPVLHPEARRWAATCWPDASQPGGWGRALWWPPYHRRGNLPVALDYADVVEFAADIPIKARRLTRWSPVCWYGVALEDSARGLIVYGPYPNPAAAGAVANELRCTLGYHYATLRRP